MQKKARFSQRLVIIIVAMIVAVFVIGYALSPMLSSKTPPTQTSGFQPGPQKDTGINEGPVGEPGLGNKP